MLTTSRPHRHAGSQPVGVQIEFQVAVEYDLVLLRNVGTPLASRASLWETALISVRQEAVRAILEQAHHALTEDRISLEIREAVFVLQGQVLTERQVTVVEALLVARGQVADLATRLDQSQI